MAILLTAVAENKNRASALCYYQYGGGKATRILPLVLLCIIAFGAVYTVSLALLPSGIQNERTEAPESIFGVHRFAETIARNIHVLGDPIDNPKPNRFRR